MSPLLFLCNTAEIRGARKRLKKCHCVEIYLAVYYYSSMHVCSYCRVNGCLSRNPLAALGSLLCCSILHNQICSQLYKEKERYRNSNGNFQSRCAHRLIWHIPLQLICKNKCKKERGKCTSYPENLPRFRLVLL